MSGPRLGLIGWLRWGWRTLTSMRTALILLSLLALTAIPGSVLPQRGVSSDPAQVTIFRQDHPGWYPVLDALWLFDVYSSPWFAAVYILLLISMTGCVIPRALKLWRAVMEKPPRPPQNIERQHGYRRIETPLTVPEAQARLAEELRGRRFRLRSEPGGLTGEAGYTREFGNLLFHLSLLLLLYGVALGKLNGFESTVIVAEGAQFSNTRSQYDSFAPGALFSDERMTQFSLNLKSLEAEFEAEGQDRGSPRQFRADVEANLPDGSSRSQVIQVNQPMTIDGTKVFLTGNGYAPRFTVRDGRGQVVFQGPAVFLPLDGNMTSEGVIKVPDALPEQLAFEGLFLPTATIDPQTGPTSSFPGPLDPRALLTVFTGDLGLDSGVPQSVYTLLKDDLTQLREGKEPLAMALTVGQTATLPEGRGSITLDGVSRFANFQVASDPGKELALIAGLLLLTGLTISLAVRRRRIWIRLAPADDGSAIVELAALALTRRGLPDGELDRIASLLDAKNELAQQK